MRQSVWRHINCKELNKHWLSPEPMSRGQELCTHTRASTLRHPVRNLRKRLDQMLTFDVLSQKLQTQDHSHTVPKFSFFLEFP